RISRPKKRDRKIIKKSFFRHPLFFLRVPPPPSSMSHLGPGQRKDRRTHETEERTLPRMRPTHTDRSRHPGIRRTRLLRRLRQTDRGVPLLQLRRTTPPHEHP